MVDTPPQTTRGHWAAAACVVCGTLPRLDPELLERRGGPTRPPSVPRPALCSHSVRLGML